ncbi:unnamed protein product [Prorocentrum cordatum]|uniref:Uncharacterized protein n=1 Tax=Prorocentrum cordatum TaxID=2364126 RepID=A0ABN9WS43_9DINO|nr:unnamed protein product [Polarella glacialis]
MTALGNRSCLRSLPETATSVCHCIWARIMMASTCAEDTASPSSPFATTTTSAMTGSPTRDGLLPDVSFLPAWRNLVIVSCTMWSRSICGLTDDPARFHAILSCLRRDRYASRTVSKVTPSRAIGANCSTLQRSLRLLSVRS